MGDLHYQSAAFTSAMEYYRSALQSEARTPQEHSQLHAKISDCLRQQGLLEDADAELAQAFTYVESLTTQELAVLMVRRARMALRHGQYEAAISDAREGYAALATTDNHTVVAQAQIALGMAHLRLGRAVKAKEFFEDALGTYRRTGDGLSQAHVLNNLAIIAKNDCRWDRALRLLERAENLLRDNGSTYEICVIRLNRGIIARKMGRLEEALVYARQGLEMARTVGDHGRTIRLKLLLGQIHIDAGRLAEAERELMEARVLAERCGGQREQTLADEFFGDLMAASGKPDQALANYQLAEERALQVNDSNDMLAEVYRRRAQVLLGMQDRAGAVAAATRGIELVEGSGEEYERPFLHRVLGQVALQEDDYDAAEDGLTASLEGFRRLRLAPEIARSLHLLFDANLRRGGTESLLKARGHLLEALRLDFADESAAQRRQLYLGLARLEFKLGNHEDALLALFDVERLDCENNTEDCTENVEALRAEIELAMGSMAQRVSDQYRAIVEPADSADGLMVADLDVALRNLASRLNARRACVILDRGGRVEVLSAWSMSKTLALRLGSVALRSVADADTSRVWTQARTDATWQAEDRAGDSIAVFRVAGPEDESQVGVYFDVVGDQDSIAFDRDSLAMVSTHIHLWRDSLLAVSLRPRSERARPEHAAFDHIITRSDAVFEILQLCSKVASSPYTVLFTGETGTGKGLLARTIHRLSPRKDGAFVMVNCAAIPETLLESELFGHLRGSFTGAERDRDGLVVEAASGTLFLDEVGKMSLPMQGKLLHFLDTKEVRPVGSSTTIQVDVRVICASKRNLRKMVDQDLFLEDLYYRLLDFPIEVPPLRDRGDDVVLLARYYADKCAEELGRPAPTLTKGFVARLRSHRWPGNVRELEKSIKRATILAGDEGRLREEHLPLELRTSAERPGSDRTAHELSPLRDQVADLEARVLEDALEATGWNRAEVARRLKISYPTLLQKIRTYDLHQL